MTAEESVEIAAVINVLAQTMTTKLFLFYLQNGTRSSAVLARCPLTSEDVILQQDVGQRAPERRGRIPYHDPYQVV